MKVWVLERYFGDECGSCGVVADRTKAEEWERAHPDNVFSEYVMDVLPPPHLWEPPQPFVPPDPNSIEGAMYQVYGEVLKTQFETLPTLLDRFCAGDSQPDGFKDNETEGHESD